MVSTILNEVQMLFDGVGELAKEGMHFTVTDMQGNPMSGVITIQNEIATVTFTDSSWELIPTGSVYKYTKSCDVSNVWSNRYELKRYKSTIGVIILWLALTI